jgi:opacity protein-like surface antigen
VGMRFLILLAVLMAALATAAAASAGQPNASCEDVGSGPPGITSTTNGFATRAVIVYAGSDGAHSLASGNDHAVSQYDVACLVSSH